MFNIDTSTTVGKSLVLFALTIMAYLLRYLLYAILANNLAIEIYGDLSIALRVLSVAAAVALLGTRSSSVRFLSKYLKHHRTNLASGFLHWNSQLVRRSFLLSVLLTTLLVLLMFHLHVFGIKDIRSYHLAVYALWLTPISALTILLSSYLMCSNHPFTSYMFFDNYRYALEISFFLVVFTVLGITPSSLTIVGILFAALLVLAVAEFIFIYRKAPFLLQFFQRNGNNNSHSKKLEASWAKKSAMLLSNNIMYIIIASTDLIILELVGKNEADVGAYSTVLIICSIIWIISHAPVRLITPKISSLIHSDQGKQELMQDINKALAFIIVSCSAVAAIIAFFSKDLLLHFGPAFVYAQPVLYLALCAPLLNMFGKMAVALLAYSDLEKPLLGITLAEFITLLVVGTILTYYYGMYGTAIATIISVAVKVIGSLIIVRRQFSIRFLGFI